MEKGEVSGSVVRNWGFPFGLGAGEGDTGRLNGPVGWAVECFNFVEQKWPKRKKKKAKQNKKGRN
jgi:hypothetical protein